MANRYKNTEIRQFSNNANKAHYGTTIYPKTIERNSDVYVITQEGDRLDTLANQFYGDPRLWWFIAQSNNIKTMNLEAGVQLRIPGSSQ